MQYAAAAKYLVLVLVAGCAASTRDAYERDVEHKLGVTPTPDRKVAAVGELAPHPWRVGQWATYSTPVRGYETISAIAVDACGMWFSDDIHTYAGRDHYLICLRTPAIDESTRPIDLVQMVIREWNDGPPVVVNFQNRDEAAHLRDSPAFAAMVARLMPATWQGDTSLRETVNVPAGHFEMAVRTVETICNRTVTRWAHPDAPFDGTVWIRGADGPSYALMAYGELGAPSVIRVLARQTASADMPPRKNAFLSLGVGSSWFTGVRDERSSGADDVVVHTGWFLTDSLGFVTTLVGSSIHRYSPDPTISQDISLGTIGVRSHPFAGVPGLAGGLFAHADLGYGVLQHDTGMDRTTVANGFVAAGGIGWLMRETRDIALGLELSDQVLFFDTPNIARHSLGAEFFIQIHVPTW